MAQPVKIPAKTAAASVNRPNMSRNEVDDFIQARLMQQQTAPPQMQQQPTNPYIQGLQNLISILMQQSPMQTNYGRKK